MNIALYIVCVVYNKEIDNIRSLKIFEEFCTEHRNIHLFLMDNSSEIVIVEKNKHFISKEKFIGEYVCNEGNIGLARCYAKAIEMIQDEDYWLMIADDDTYFSLEYLNNAYTEIENNKSKIITGIVRCGERYLSPINTCKVFLKEDNFIKKCGRYTNIYCINSGLFIHSYILSRIPYDTRFFVDMIDYWLMEKLMAEGMNNIFIVAGDIQQNFSGYQKNVNIETMKKRFEIYKKDFVLFCDETGKGWIYKYVTLLRRWLHILFLQLVNKFRNTKKNK